MRLRFLLLLTTLTLTACVAAPQGVDVPPPLVITVVVTQSGSNPPPTESQAATPESSTPSPTAATAQYPAPFQNQVDAVYQDFERGFMIYLADRQAIWVFGKSIPDPGGTPVATQSVGVWLAFADNFKDGDPETDPAFEPPVNYQQPKRGFGKVWRENANVRDLLGWGLDYERPYTASVTDYSIGTFDSNGGYAPQSFIHLVTTANGLTVHIDETTRTWSKP
jgi:hypothetical protein